MNARTLCCAAIASVQISGNASPLQGQRTDQSSPAITGIVTDTSGRPVAGASVLIAALRRSAVAGSDGTFVVPFVPQGRYELVVRRIGYAPATTTVRVAEAPVAVRIRLIPLPLQLAPAITSATRTGLAGVVADTARLPLANATIDVIGARRSVSTDASGAFSMEIEPGSYMIRVSRAGYADQTMSIRIPPNEGRQVAIWLTPAAKAHSSREGVALFDMNRRITWRRKAISRLFTSEDIDSLPVKDLQRIATIGGGQLVAETCPAIVDGGPSTVPLWSIDPRQVEFIEVYGSTAPARPNSCASRVYVWFKK